MSYKLLKEHADKYEMQHPNGSRFVIAKKGLNSKVSEHIQKLYDGGIAGDSSYMPEKTKMEDPTLTIPQATQGQDMYQKQLDLSRMSNPNMPEEYHQQFAQASVVPNLDRQAMAGKNADILSKDAAAAKLQEDLKFNAVAKAHGLPERTINMPQAQQSMDQIAPQAAPVDQSAAATANQAQGMQSPSLMGAYEQQSQGLAENAAAQQAQAKANAQTLAGVSQNMQKVDNAFETSTKALKAEQDDLQTKLSTAQIDPNRMYNNMGTAGKISASIGLILGGIGAGLTHGENAALKVINNAIDHDIDAQKANIDKTSSLYKMNLEKFRDSRAAHDATKLQLLTAADLKMKQAEQTAKSAEAAAALKMSRGQLQQQMAPLMMQQAMRQVDMQLTGSGGSGKGGIPTGQVPTYMYEDKEKGPKLVDVNGTTYMARSEEEAKTLRTQTAKTAGVIDQINQLKALGSSALIPGTAANQTAQSIQNRLATEIPLAMGLGRINETEIHQALKEFSDPTALTQAFNPNSRSNQFLKTLQNEYHNELSNKLIGYKPDGGAQAQQSGSDIKTMGGVKYQKTSGGWQKVK